MEKLRNRIENRKKGLCWDCTQPAIKGQTRCEKHYWMNNASCAKYYRKNHQKRLQYYRDLKLKRKKEGKCSTCGNILAEIDNGFKCVNCRVNNYGTSYIPA